MEETFLFIIEVIGTFAFAISGIRLAAFKSFDWFGAYTVGLVTAIGGGTLRDVLLDIPVFWMQTWMYLAVTAASLAVVIMFRKLLVSKDRMLFLFDTLGLALFVVIGIQKTLAAGYPMWVAIAMGLLTGLRRRRHGLLGRRGGRVVAGAVAAHLRSHHHIAAHVCPPMELVAAGAAL